MRGDQLASGGRQATFQGPAREKEGTDVFREPGLQPVADDPFDPGPLPHGVIPEEKTVHAGYEGDPSGDCVLILRVEKEHTSNLIIPDSMKARSDIGFVKAVGEAVKFYKAGQLVLFDRFASHGADICLIDEEGIERNMLLLREYDILMRLKKVNL